MRKVYQAYVSDRLSMHAYGEQYLPLDERFQQLEEEIPRLQGEIDFLKIQHLASEEVLSEARDLYTRWRELSFEEKRQIVETIVDRIEIGDGEVAIELLYLSPSLSEMAKGQRNNTRSVPFCHLELRAPRPDDSGPRGPFPPPRCSDSAMRVTWQ